jgi:hypothetical protein
MPDNSWVDPQDFNVNSRLRASDADRDSAAAVINNALAEGRLSAEEHSERLDAIFSAKTHAELVPILDDLPTARGLRQEFASPRPSSADVDLAPGSPRGARMTAIFSGVSRKGVWHPEPVTRVLAVFGGAELDYREAVLPGPEIVLDATAVLGGVEIIVPPEMRVVDNGTAILGGREITGDPAEALGPDSPLLRIEGICVLGGIEVKRKARKVPKALRRRKGVNVSVEANPVPVLRIKSADKDD